MTAYTDFPRGFPGRCLEVLGAASSGATADGREIPLLYKDGSTRIDPMLEAETLWLNQKQLTEMRVPSKSPGQASP